MNNVFFIKASPLQEGVYFHREQSGDSNWMLYNCHLYKGVVDETVFRQSFLLLLKQNDILRTNFVIKDNILYQKINEFAEQQYIENYKYYDYSKIEDEDTIARLKDFYVQINARALDLSRDPLFRLSLFQFKRSFVILFEIHHIITDVTSSQIILAALLDSYIGLLRGDGMNLQRIKQYWKYSLEYEKFLLSDKYFSEVSYWTGKIERSVPLNIRFLLQRAEKSIDMDVYFFSKAMLNKVRSFTLTHKLFLSTPFLLAYMILLNRLTGRTNISVKNIINGRLAINDSTDNQSVIGLLARRILNSLEINGEERILDLLKKLNVEQVDSFHHSNLSLEEVLRLPEAMKNGIKSDSLDASFNMIVNRKTTIDNVFGDRKRLFLTEDIQMGWDSVIELAVLKESDFIKLSLSLKDVPSNEKYSNRILSNYIFIFNNIVNNPLIRLSDILLLPYDLSSASGRRRKISAKVSI